MYYEKPNNRTNFSQIIWNPQPINPARFILDFVVPAKAGTQYMFGLDTRLRGYDGFSYYSCRINKICHS